MENDRIYVFYRPLDSKSSKWAVDHYDKRGGWKKTIVCDCKKDAQKEAKELRRELKKK